MKRENKYTIIALFSFLLIILFFIFQQTRLINKIDESLQECLSLKEELPLEKTFDAAYILGGNQDSLDAKYIYAASIFANGLCKTILILSRPGTTEYNLALGRNLTNDEWSLMRLEKYGVPQENIQALKIAPGFFGTYAEAEYVSKLVNERGWKNLLIITSPHHTNRVKKSFTHFTGSTITNFWVAASNHKVNFLEHLSELFKFKFYQLFLLSC